MGTVGTAEGPSRPQVLVLTGYQRSGSTILDVLLGQHPEVFGAGELGGIWTLGWTDPWPCACGEPVARCPFWREVRRTVERELGPEVFAEGAALRGRERLRWFGSAAVGGAPWERWAVLQDTLYAAVSAQAGTRWIVDSSKQPTRAMALRRAATPTTVLHLVRGLKPTVGSVRRGIAAQDAVGAPAVAGKSTVRATIEWSLTNAAAALAARPSTGRPQPLGRLDHRDLIERPIPTIERLCASLGLDPEPLARLIRDGTPLRPGHQVGGNPIRFERELRLQRG